MNKLDKAERREARRHRRKHGMRVRGRSVLTLLRLLGEGKSKKRRKRV